MEEIILDAIKRANKLGAKGIEVIGYVEPQSAGDDYNYTLVTSVPDENLTAGDKPWYL